MELSQNGFAVAGVGGGFLLFDDEGGYLGEGVAMLVFSRLGSCMVAVDGGCRTAEKSWRGCLRCGFTGIDKASRRRRQSGLPYQRSSPPIC